ncbi:hypothetical protein PZ938_10180 [Luteipulveratus sp. YIM 133132]|uniref:peptidoglycan-binding domain-containing protein n=1 Tax=Luteipulveratus flavus TaxID=3031728 RepID=UPI0023AE7B99|nr:peptidoglycan-binding protein [Luteipulveratus sp. YIM 133132]MDE9365970.1 hypothetical protein [Luteipulveratus sp. YIM 133132]
MATTADRVIDLATSYVGLREIGDNDCYATDRISRPYFGVNGEWCNAGTSSVLDQYGLLGMVGGPSINTVTTLNRCRARGYEVPYQQGKKGAFVEFDFNKADDRPTSHIEMLREDYRGDGILRTSGWNTTDPSDTSGNQSAGGRVALRDRSLYGLVAVFNLPYPAGDPGPLLPEIGAGSRGDRVKTVQAVVGATVDGVYGSGTRAAVRAFQKANDVGLWGSDIPNAGMRGTAKGFIDRATWDLISPPVPVYADTLMNKWVPLAPRKLLQARLDVDADGDFADESYAAWASRLGLPADAGEQRIILRAKAYLNLIDNADVAAVKTTDGVLDEQAAAVLVAYLGVSGSFNGGASMIGRI